MTDQSGPREPISVLIVEDDDVVAESLARCCESPELAVVSVVASGCQAIRAGSKYRPDVVLMDLRLGDDNGIEVAKELLTRTPTSKVVIVTGAASPQLESAARRAGCAGCIQKDMQLARTLPGLIQRAFVGEPVGPS